MDNDIDQVNPSQFKPMSEGLGLNHFADGLPYAPAHTKRKPMVHFNFPPNDERIVVKTGSQSQQEPEIAPPLDAWIEDQASAVWVKRVMAFGLDLGFAAAIFALIVWSSFTLNGYDLARLLQGRAGAQMFWPLALLYAVVHCGYFLIQETTWRRTLGKALMGIRIRSNSGYSTIGRAVCFFISAIPFGLGLFWCFFDPRRRCWHDVITDSDVVTG